MNGRKTLAILLHLLGAEQFRAQRVLVEGVLMGIASVAYLAAQVAQVMEKT